MNKQNNNPLFEQNLSRSKSNIYMMLSFFIALIMVYKIGEMLVSFLATIVFIFLIMRVLQVKKLPFAEMTASSLVLRPQAFWGEKVIFWDDITSATIADNVNRTITITLHENAEYKCHGWCLKPEDDKRFIREIQKRGKCSMHG